MGDVLHIDEVALSKGELYTFVTNPKGKGKQKTIVAIIEGTKSQDIIRVLDKIPLVYRKRVKVVASDMAPNMQAAMRRSFENAEIVIDKFHVIRLVLEALQSARVSYRWKVIDLENERLKLCKAENYIHKIRIYSNGDTERQLLARSTYLLYKSPEKWTESQKERALILFKNYPRLKVLYGHVMKFRRIYEIDNKKEAVASLNSWIEDSFQLKENVFHIAARSIKTHFENITNYFTFKVTNAFAESFNAKIKRFRFNLKGVSDHAFFQYRLTKLFA